MKPGITVKGEKIPDTVAEWKYLAELYAEKILEDKITIEKLKSKINKLEQKK
jgi:hypothetical protein